MYILSGIFYKFGQNGFYLDFVGKKIIENFIRGVFLLNSQIFNEKYMIEFLTKNIFESFFNNLTKLTNPSKFSQELFFFNLVCSVFFLLILFQIIFFII